MRRLTVVALSAILLLAACRDQEPTEPAIPAPDELSTTACGAIPFPLLTVSNQIIEVFPNGRLKIEAIARAGEIKFYWDTCKPAPARKAAVGFIEWMNEHFDSGRLRGATAEEVQTLTVTILNGVGVEVTAPTATGDIGVGIYDGEKTLIKTASEVALTEIEADAFADGEPRLIVVQRNPDDFQLTDFGGRQFPPYFDYDATKLEGSTLPADKVLAPDKFAIIAFCLLPQTDEFQYPDQPRIGHNPVAGADLPAFEILEPVALVAGAEGENRQDLRDELSCDNLNENPGGGTILLRGLGGGLPDLAQAAFGKAERILGPFARSLLLPQPLSATALVGFSGPIAGKTTSLSPFGVVEPGTSTTTTITSDTPDPSNQGDPVTVAFTVTASQGTPSGNVTVSDGNGSSCIANVDAGSCVLIPAGTGTITLTAAYEGNESFNSSSDTEEHTVVVGLGTSTFGVNSGDDGLSTIDLATGAVSFIGPLDANVNLYTTPVAMAAGPLDQKLYVWNNSGDGTNEGAPTGVLLTVDPGTGQATPVDAATPAQGTLGGLAFTPGGALYGTNSDLFSINPATGVRTLIGSLGSGLRVTAADFDCNGTLHGVEFAFGSQRLVTIDLTSGAATVGATLSQDMGLVQSILFTQSGALVATGAAGPLGNTLFDIDPLTGIVSNVRSVSGNLPQGLGAARTCAPVLR